MPYKDFTPQEELAADILTEYGIRFVQQWSVPYTNYVADFYIPELHMVLECDGAIGHLRKADAERTEVILRKAVGEVKQVSRVDAVTKSKLKEQIWQVLTVLDQDSQSASHR
jgi:very-short-patch-repair endonuclease